MDLPLDIMQANAGRATALLKSMANETRLMILCQLSQREMTVGELIELVGLSQSALSQHLGVLRREGLVKTRRESQTIYYSLEHGPADRVITLLHDIYCGQDECSQQD